MVFHPGTGFILLLYDFIAALASLSDGFLCVSSYVEMCRSGTLL